MFQRCFDELTQSVIIKYNQTLWFSTCDDVFNLSNSRSTFHQILSLNYMRFKYTTYPCRCKTFNPKPQQMSKDFATQFI